ncbi:MAG: hypothetical protein HRT35_20995 [Algicola sp.]|nr:hypothetical protein [Algicola sp.]
MSVNTIDINTIELKAPPIRVPAALLTKNKLKAATKPTTQNQSKLLAGYTVKEVAKLAFLLVLVVVAELVLYNILQNALDPHSGRGAAQQPSKVEVRTASIKYSRL